MRCEPALRLRNKRPRVVRHGKAGAVGTVLHHHRHMTTPPDFRDICAGMLHDFDDLVQNSDGVAGLHRNGDIADWHSLTEGSDLMWAGQFARARAALKAVPATPAPGPVAVPTNRHGNHPDDEAVDRFAAAMKDKLDYSRKVRGRGGWQHATAARLSKLLYEHLAKGDPVDIGNFAMMLHQNDQRFLAPGPVPVAEWLPEAGDCLILPTGPDGELEWWCWFYHAGLEGVSEWRWNTTPRLSDWYGWQGITHWAPHWALPLPEVQP